MAFEPKQWHNYPNTSTPITATELHRIERGLRDAEAALNDRVDLAIIGRNLQPEDDLSDLPNGRYRVQTGSTAEALGLPSASGGHHGVFETTRFTSTGLYQSWIPRTGGAPQIWIRQGLVSEINQTRWTPVIAENSSSGWVNLDITGSDFIGGSARTKRIGDLVELNIRHGRIKPKNTTVSLLGVIPVDHRPRHDHYAPLPVRTSQYAEGPIRITPSGDVHIYNTTNEKTDIIANVLYTL